MKDRCHFQRRCGFTLIELLVVISIMAVLAALTISVLNAFERNKNLKIAGAELEEIKTALQNYHAKYGVYPPGNPGLSPAVNTLYYELSGVTHDAIKKNFTTLDGACIISESDYASAFSAGGFSIGGVINCTRGAGDDKTAAINFLSGLRQNRCGSYATGAVSITNLITSVGGPDHNYLAALQAQGFSGNPFNYACPGTNNPSSYDLWVDLKFSGKTYRIKNW
jgi:prepilin-type N-terminal cleavage/methylation domain-containing protein